MKIIVVGCGRMGSGLARSLSLNGHAVTVVARDPAQLERLGAGFKGRMVTGVEFDRNVLLEAGIQRIDGLAAVTASDEVNVVTARMASQLFRVPRVVARLYDPRKAEIYQRLGVQTIDPTTWGIHRISELLGYSTLEPVLSLGAGGVDLLELEAPPLLVGRTVKDLEIPEEIRIVAISRGGKTFLPTLGTVFQGGDVVHLAVNGGALSRLHSLLGLP